MKKKKDKGVLMTVLLFLYGTFSFICGLLGYLYSDNLTFLFNFWSITSLLLWLLLLTEILRQLSQLEKCTTSLLKNSRPKK